MARQWQRLSLGEAKRHPLYGIKNWLAVFAFGILVSPLRTVGELSNSAGEAGLTLSQVLSSNTQIATFIKAGLAFDLAIAALLLWLLFSKYRHFRVATVAVLILQWPAYFFVAYITGGAEIPGVAGAFVQQFLSSLLLNAIWVTYVQRSRRVRVTFENCVVVEETGVSATYRNSAPSAATSTATAGNDAYAAALAEIEDHRLDKGTWARSFAESGGDESKAKALYIKARAETIGNEAVWVDAQQPTTDSERAEAVKTSRTSQSDDSLPKWMPAFIAFAVVAGVVGYQQLNSRQTVAASQIQAPAPQVDWSQYETVKVEPTGNSYGSPGRPLTRNAYEERVHAITAGVESGAYLEVIGTASFNPPVNRMQFPDGDPQILESNQTSWHERHGELRIHVQNTATADLTVLGLNFEDQGCGSNIGKQTFYVFLANPIMRSAQAVIRFRPNFPLGKGRFCLVVSSLWS